MHFLSHLIPCRRHLASYVSYWYLKSISVRRDTSMPSSAIPFRAAGIQLPVSHVVYFNPYLPGGRF